MSTTTTTAVATPAVIVYGKPVGCQGCTLTKRKLEKDGVPYVWRDITTDPAAHARVMELGYASVPVVEVGDVHWSGYRHERLGALAGLLAEAATVTELEDEARAYLTEGDL